VLGGGRGGGRVTVALVTGIGKAKFPMTVVTVTFHVAGFI